MRQRFLLLEIESYDWLLLLDPNKELKARTNRKEESLSDQISPLKALCPRY